MRRTGKPSTKLASRSAYPPLQDSHIPIHEVEQTGATGSLARRLLVASSLIALAAAAPVLTPSAARAQVLPAGCTDGNNNIAENGETVTCLPPPTPIDGVDTTVDDLTIVVGSAGTATTIDGGGGASGVRMVGDNNQTLTILNTGSSVSGQAGLDVNIFNGVGDLTITNAGTVDGDDAGVYAIQYGDGDLLLMSTGDIMAGGDGILAYTGSTAGSMTINTSGGMVDAGGTGVRVYHSGTGDLSITTGDVTGTDGYGITANVSDGVNFTIDTSAGTVYAYDTGVVAYQYGTGDLSITTAGVQSDTNHGIYAYSGAGNTTINTSAGAVTAYANGINFRQYGNGSLSITTAGVTSTQSDAIYAQNKAAGTTTTINTTAGTVVGYSSGINIRHYATGNLSITTGDVIGTYGYGVYAYHGSGSSGQTIINTSGGTIHSYYQGVRVLHEATGAISITTADVISDNSDGILVNGYNTPLLTVNTSAGHVQGHEYGMRIFQDDGSVSITTADVTAGPSGGSSVGLYVENTDTGYTTINTSAGTVTGTFHGIVVFHEATGNASITTANVTGGTVSGNANGIRADSSGGGLTINTSAGTVTGSGTALYANNGGTGNLSITTANVTGGSGGVDQAGIMARNFAGALTINTTAGSVMGPNYGIYAYHGGTGNLNISVGNVTGTAESGVTVAGTSGSVNASVSASGTVVGGQYGFEVYSGSSGALTVTVAGSGDVSGGVAGIRLFGGHTGTSNINVLGQVSGPTGIIASAFATSITTSGFVQGTGGTAIQLGLGDDTLTVNTGASFDGLIAFDGGTNTVNVCSDSAMSASFTLDNGGTLNFNDCTTQGTAALAGNTFSTVDANIGFVQMQESVLDVSEFLFDSLGLQNGGLTSVMEEARKSISYQVAMLGSSPTGPKGRKDKGAWVRGLGGFLDKSEDGPSPGSDQRFWGALMGSDLWQGRRVALGLFGGYVGTDVEVGNNQQTIDSTRYLGGGYLNSLFGGWHVNVSALGGGGEHRQGRDVNSGLERAYADYKSTFVSAGASVERAFGDYMKGIGFKPGFGVTYSAEYVDGYTETNIASPLIVDDFLAAGVTGYAEIAFLAIRPTQGSDLFGVEVRAGAKGRENTGDDEINVTLLGSNLSFEPVGKDTSVDGYVGIGVEGSFYDQIVIFADLEGRKGGETQGGVTAQTGIKWIYN